MNVRYMDNIDTDIALKEQASLQKFGRGKRVKCVLRCGMERNTILG